MSPMGQMSDAGGKRKVSSGSENIKIKIKPMELVHNARTPSRFSEDSHIATSSGFNLKLSLLPMAS